VVSLIFVFIVKFKNSPYVDWIFKGIRPVVFGLILAAGITVARTSIVDIKSFLVGVLLFYLVTFRKFNPIWGIILAGTLGVIFF
jgi:chromate transporter